MELAIEKAKAALNIGEIPVGCVIVERASKKIISQSHNLVENHNNPLMHAEMISIAETCKIKCSKNLQGCDIYITVEPCPMCATAISYARLDRLYYATRQPKLGAIETKFQLFSIDLHLHRPEIYSGICEKESQDLLGKFFSTCRQNKI